MKLNCSRPHPDPDPRPITRPKSLIKKSFQRALAAQRLYLTAYRGALFHRFLPSQFDLLRAKIAFALYGEKNGAEAIIDFPFDEAPALFFQNPLPGSYDQPQLVRLFSFLCFQETETLAPSLHTMYHLAGSY